MWRIHFSADDLARTRVAPSLGPLAETLFGLVMIRSAWPVPMAMLGWREEVRRLLTPAMKPLTDLAPQRTFGLDLWSLTGEASTIEQGLEALQAMRPNAIRIELTGFTQTKVLPSSSWRLAEKDGAARQELASAARLAYSALVEPFWGRVAGHLEAERMVFSRYQLDGGIELLFNRLAPAARWESPVLHVRSYTNVDIHLNGRGLTLVPSYFLGDMPLLLMDPLSFMPPKLVFPVAREAISLLSLPRAGSVSQALADLVGRNRARVLAAIGAGCTTTELSRRTQISMAAASQHATVLRRAGLVMTRREGTAVRHTLTPLGTALLEQVGGYGSLR